MDKRTTLKQEETKIYWVPPDAVASPLGAGAGGDVVRIAGTYRGWRNLSSSQADTGGFCKAANREEVATNKGGEMLRRITNCHK